MVARTGRYYSTALRGFRRVTQGYLLSPTIFNVVVDAVVCNWVLMVVVDVGLQIKAPKKWYQMTSILG